MSWFYEHSVVPSEKNGSIVVDRFFGTWSIRVDGFHETTTYLRDMWRGALRRLPRGFKPERILMFGLGAGGEVRTLQKRFKKAHITVIEWDPAMIAVAKRCKMFTWNDRVTVINADAHAGVEKTSDYFDLIILDLFTGSITSPLYSNHEFLAAIEKKLTRDGYLITNFFRMPEYKNHLANHFAATKYWKYWFNDLGLYKKQGSGVGGDLVPKEFLHHRQSRSYLTKSEHAKAVIGKDGALGSAVRLGPFSFESFTTDTEPDTTPGTHVRLIRWQRVSRTDRPSGWIPWHEACGKQTGFFDASTVMPDNYWQSWSTHAKRHRSHWLKHQPYIIERVRHDEFIRAYSDGTHLKVLKYGFLNVLKWVSREHKEHMICWGARSKEGKIVAGLAVLDLPDISMSNHTMAFVSPEATKTSVGTIMIDEWFRHCLAIGIRFMNFGGIWAPGDPSSWKGFSRFKIQFGIHVIRYPRQLIKIVW